VWADRYNKGSLHTDYQLHYKWPSKEAYTAAAAPATATTIAPVTTAVSAPAAVPAATAAAEDNNNESGDHRSVSDAAHGGESPVPNGQTNGNINNDSNQQQQQQQQNSVHNGGDSDSLDELYGNVNSAAAGYHSDTESAATSLQGDTPSNVDPLHAVELAAEHDRAAQQFTQRARADHVRELLRDVTYVSEQVRSSCL
jgi:hypothetical protein